MQIAVFVFERITMLDAIGPYEVLSRLPGATVEWVGREAGPVRADAGCVVLAEKTLSEVPRPDILVIPGGYGIDAVLEQPEVLAWIRDAHEHTQWTTSVCTGSFALGAAGLLDGLRATSHWAQIDRLKDYGASPTHERVVEQGKVVTAAGVSSGIDMGLRLIDHIAGDAVAQAIQLSIEYDPQPPFDSGHPHKAPEEAVTLVRQAVAERRARAS